MSGLKSKRSYLRRTPECLLLGLLAAQGVLFLGDRFWLFGLERGNLWNIQLAGALVAGSILIWPIGALVGRLLGSRWKFNLRCLLLLTVAAAVPSAWYAHWRRSGEWRKAAFVQLQTVQSRICSGKLHRRGTTLSASQSGSRLLLVGVSFAVEEDYGCGCCYHSVATDVCDEELSGLARFHEIERLSIPDAEITDAGLVHLRGLKRLRYLDLSGNQITDTGLVHLRGLTDLEYLNLSHTRITDAGFVHLAKLENLERLDFGCTPAMGEGANHLAGIRALKCCSGSGSCRPLLSVEGARQLARLESLEELRGIIVSPGSDGESGKSLLIDGHDSLRIVELGVGCELETIRLADLPSLEQADVHRGPCIHHVHCHAVRGRAKKVHCGCSEKIGRFEVENLPQLESLDVCEVGRFEVRQLPRLENLNISKVDDFILQDAPQVNQVSLRDAVTEDHLRQIAALPQLRCLQIQEDRFARPELLGRLGSLPMLEELRLSGKGLTDASLQVLEDAPALRILSLPEGEFSGTVLSERLKQLRALQYLEISGVRESGEPLAGLCELQNLKKLDVTRSEIDSLRLVDMRSLEWIDISGGRIGSLELVDLPQLEMLRFMDSVTIRRLSAQRLSKLESLSMNYKAAKEPLVGVELEGLPALTYLGLPGDERFRVLTDECFEQIDTFTSLIAVDISNSCITDQTLQRLFRLPRLKRVDIRGTDTTEAATERLRKRGVSGINVRQSGPR